MFCMCESWKRIRGFKRTLKAELAEVKIKLKDGHMSETLCFPVMFMLLATQPVQAMPFNVTGS